MKLSAPIKSLSLSISLCVVATGCTDSNQAESNTPAISDLATITSDDVPGFGVSTKNAQRDDTIALWEAYQRETIVKNCMKEADFHYEIEVAFPAGVAVSVAKSLKLPDPHSVKRAGSLAGMDNGNYQRARALPASDEEQYFQRLFGESASDMALVESTGVLPPGRADFARGGCFGVAWAAIPGIYDLKRTLAAEIEESWKAEFANRSTQVSECGTARDDAVSYLATAEPEFERNSSTISSACLAAQKAIARAAKDTGIKQTLSKNETLTRAHLQHYELADTAIEEDTDFLAFLSFSTHGLELDNMLRMKEEEDN